MEISSKHTAIFFDEIKKRVSVTDKEIKSFMELWDFACVKKK